MKASTNKKPQKTSLGVRNFLCPYTRECALAAVESQAYMPDLREHASPTYED